jgi:hypothetical protein
MDTEEFRLQEFQPVHENGNPVGVLFHNAVGSSLADGDAVD